MSINASAAIGEVSAAAIASATTAVSGTPFQLAVGLFGSFFDFYGILWVMVSDIFFVAYLNILNNNYVDLKGHAINREVWDYYFGKYVLLYFVFYVGSYLLELDATHNKNNKVVAKVVTDVKAPNIDSMSNENSAGGTNVVQKQLAQGTPATSTATSAILPSISPSPSPSPSSTKSATTTADAAASSLSPAIINNAAHNTASSNNNSPIRQQDASSAISPMNTNSTSKQVSSLKSASPVGSPTTAIATSDTPEKSKSQENTVKIPNKNDKFDNCCTIM